MGSGDTTMVLTVYEVFSNGKWREHAKYTCPDGMFRTYLAAEIAALRRHLGTEDFIENDGYFRTGDRREWKVFIESAEQL